MTFMTYLNPSTATDEEMTIGLSIEYPGSAF